MGKKILLGRGCDPTQKFVAVYLAKRVVSSSDTRLGRSLEWLKISVDSKK